MTTVEHTGDEMIAVMMPEDSWNVVLHALEEEIWQLSDMDGGSNEMTKDLEDVHSTIADAVRSEHTHTVEVDAISLGQGDTTIELHPGDEEEFRTSTRMFVVRALGPEQADE